MKVLKIKSREYKGKKYYKYRINVPLDILKMADFKEGDELVSETKKGSILLKKK